MPRNEIKNLLRVGQTGDAVADSLAVSLVVADRGFIVPVAGVSELHFLVGILEIKAQNTSEACQARQSMTSTLFRVKNRNDDGIATRGDRAHFGQAKESDLANQVAAVLLLRSGLACGRRMPGPKGVHDASGRFSQPPRLDNLSHHRIATRGEILNCDSVRIDLAQAGATVQQACDQ